jgi:hypothetical protein
MKQQTKWIAAWSDKNGQTRTLTFESAESQGVALIDFKLRLIDLGEPIPERYTLGRADTDPQATLILPRVRR